LHGVRRERHVPPVRAFLGEPIQEVIDKRRDVGAAIPQWRNREMNDVEPVVEILSELALVDQMTEGPVGRRNHPHVDDRPRSFGADLLELAGLEETQQQPLHPQRHLADFIHEHSALVRHFELARLVTIGPGEAALDVTEQLRLEERLRQAGAVHRDEVVVLPRPLGMDGPGDDFLARAAFARNKHLCIGSGDAEDLLTKLLHQGTRANNQR
jgi:hypothetical protein